MDDVNISREDKIPQFKLAIVQYIVLAIFLVIGYGLWRLQVLGGDKFETLAEHNRVREIPIHGISVTMPYKEAILPHLDNTDSHTTKIGACNTVVRAQDGKLYGFNTDAAGIVRPLERRLTLRVFSPIVVLLAGSTLESGRL